MVCIGACDVTSAISLFRRKVRNVIICEAAEYDTINDVDPDCDSLRRSFKDIYCLFGQASEVGQPRGFNKVPTTALVLLLTSHTLVHT